MKRTKDEIRKRTIIVLPDYDRDPNHRQGQVGKIVDYFPEKKIITVLFKDRHKGVYMPDALVTLKPTKAILRALRVGVLIKDADCQIMLKVYRLAFIGRQAKALRLAMTNNITRFYCTASVIELLGKAKSLSD